MSGLPAAVAADLSVSGPSGYARALTATETLTGLAVGSYTVTAAGVSSAGFSYGAQVTGSPATVTDGGNPQVSVVFLPPAPSVTALTPKKGDFTVAGVSVAVTGTDFTPGTTVTFGGVAGVVQLINDKTSLLAKAPVLPPGTVDVRVTTPGGTSPVVVADQLASYRFTAYPVPSGGGQGGMVLGPDGNLWFTERARGKVGRATPAGVVTEFPVPDGSANGLPVTGGPVDIAVGADGNLWFTSGSSASQQSCAEPRWIAPSVPSGTARGCARGNPRTLPSPVPNRLPDSEGWAAREGPPKPVARPSANKMLARPR